MRASPFLAVNLLALGAGLALLGATWRAPQSEKWVSLFDGKTLEGWTPKIKGYPAGENFANTFRVVDGVIQVNYDGYGGKFENRFGHLFFRSPFSSYKLRLEYRFLGQQLPDGPGWALRNSGVMIHGQTPASMRKDQDFPVSIEVQLLGGDGKSERHTANMCSPGTNVVMNGKLITQHCVDSRSKTFTDGEWVRLEIEVHGSGRIVHRINGEVVMEYEGAQLDENDVDGKALMRDGKKMLEGGTISLQSESHPVEFRQIEIAVLKP